MKAKARLAGGELKLKLPCVRKGVVIGRAACAVNDLNTQLSVLDAPDPAIARGAAQDLVGSLPSLRRGLRTAGAELAEFGAAAESLEKALRAKPETWRPQDLKAGLKAVQHGFRKAVRAGFAECGAGGISDAGLAELVGDNAYFLEIVEKKRDA